MSHAPETSPAAMTPSNPQAPSPPESSRLPTAESDNHPPHAFPSARRPDTPTCPFVSRSTCPVSPRGSPASGAATRDDNPRIPAGAPARASPPDW